MTGWTAFAAGLLGGLAGWTLLEYVIHRWLGHLPKGRILTSREHLDHHADILYFTPLALKIRGALPVLGGVLLATGLLWNGPAALGSTLAVALGWSLYEWLHQSIHVRGPRNAYTRWVARHHLSHHFQLPNANFGVTSPLWDWLFLSYQPVRQVRVPARFAAALPWLKPARAAGGAAEFVDA